MSGRDVLALEWIVLAHLIAGFLLPTHLLVRSTASESPTHGLVPHAIGVAACFVPFALVYGTPGLAFALVAAISHPLIDLARRLSDRRLTASGKRWVPTLALALLFEQLGHMVILVSAWWILLVGASPVAGFASAVDSIAAARDPAAFHLAIRGLVVLSAVVIANTALASRLIGLVVPPDVHDEDEPPVAGHTAEPDEAVGAMMAASAGILERFLVIAFVLARVDVAAVLILATKELSRRQRIEQDARFAERYLIGTFSSFAFAVGTAYLARLALGI
jgi:hypothetical protein